MSTVPGQTKPDPHPQEARPPLTGRLYSCDVSYGCMHTVTSLASILCTTTDLWSGLPIAIVREGTLIMSELLNNFEQAI